jgi:hypothetical protein
LLDLLAVDVRPARETQTVCDGCGMCLSLLELAGEPLSGLGIVLPVHENVEHIPVPIDCTPSTMGIGVTR